MTAPSNDRSIGQLVTDALDDVRSIVQHEKALVKAEITRAVKVGGVGAGLLATAVGLLSLAVIFLLVAAAQGLVAAGLAPWAAFLIVGGALLLLAVLLALVGVVSLKKISGPTRAVEQGKGTVDDVKHAFGSDDTPEASSGAAKAAATAAGPADGTRR
ncbi:phage holin family protein [Jannaschia sp. R86511]|uniref:phage holin family protein n=1 Tax=Jannaschia sp. R86511 TaxID=3093853 RepID=UPI0036D43540